MKVVIRFITLILLANFQSTEFSNASPHPATASSLGLSPVKGLFFARKGFILPAPAHWTLDSDGSENDEEFSVEYQSKTLGSAKLALKTDTLKNSVSLEAYAKKWMKDYSSYGFDLLGAKPFTNENKAKGLVVDLKHRKKNQQIRQVIYLQNKTAVTLTCLDDIKSFQQTLADCNLFFKNFSWLENKTNLINK